MNLTAQRDNKGDAERNLKDNFTKFVKGESRERSPKTQELSLFCFLYMNMKYLAPQVVSLSGGTVKTSGRKTDLNEVGP